MSEKVIAFNSFCMMVRLLSKVSISKHPLWLLAFASILLLGGCEEDESICYSGTVLGRVSCTGSDGTAFLVHINLPGGSERVVGTTSLPSSLQDEGLRVSFKMRASEDVVFCTTDIVPPKFYELVDVSTDPCGE